MSALSLKDIFLRALDLPHAERARFVDQACAGDEVLRAGVLDLLSADERAGDFLDTAAVLHENAAPAVEPRIGDYRLLDAIGEGGFGIVYAAVQEKPLVRRVAIKVVKAGMDSHKLIARFEAERQTLALMDHPGIAKIYDAGTTQSGRPYFVMELVDGEHLTHFCDERDLDLRARLELFEQVVRAVQHAHNKGIIHRDLKPSNILVSLIDGRAVPKIIDFGIAKALRPDSVGSAGSTRDSLTAEYELVGTPEYSAPEQASSASTDVDTRADIYSLGVILYRLVSRSSPYDLQALTGAGIEAWLRAIRESTPVPPSQRTRDAVPIDVDWIVGKAIEKDRLRRFPTADAFRADIRRYLDGEPVEAGPPSTWYRLRRVAWRHRVAVSLALTVLIAALATALIATRAAGRAEKQAYVANVFAAQAALADGDTVSARRRLERTAESLRAWEWHYLDRRVERAAWSHSVPGKIACIGFDPDSGRTAVCKQDGGVALIEPASGDFSTARFQLDGLDEVPRAVCFGPKGRNLYCGTSSGQLLRLELDSGNSAPFGGHAQNVQRLLIARSTGQLISAGWDGAIHIWSLATLDLERSLQTGSAIERIVLSPDERTLAVGTWDQQLCLWDFASGERLASERVARPGTPVERSMRWAGGSVQALCFTPDSRQVLCGVRDGNVVLLDARSGNRDWEYGGHERLIRSVAVAPDGGRIAIASRDRSVSLWSTLR